MSSYADILVPIPLPRLFTYSIAKDQEVKIGHRVLVPLGRRKIYTGIVRQIHDEPPSLYKPKEILEVLDPAPLIGETQLKFWDWMARYYVCSPGEVMTAALPAGLKLESETRVRWVAQEEIDPEELNENQFLIAQALEQQNELKLSEISEIIGKTTIHPIIQSMIKKEWVEVVERVEEKYKPKTEILWRLAFLAENEDLLELSFQNVANAPKQRTALFQFLDDARLNHPGRSASEWHKKFGIGRAALTAMRDKGIVESYTFEHSRLSFNSNPEEKAKALSPAQQNALDELKTAINTRKVQLLHGVTGSGKTEIYIHLIEEALERGEQVLYLLPEIALTTQIIQRLKKYFGDAIGVFHSHYSQNERAEVWQAVARFPEENSYSIVLGARSAVFLPFENLGLVIVDEEHESSFKQFDPAPRYHGRDAAIVLARLHGAMCILGSATPSLESYYNAKIGKYDYVSLTDRFGELLLPEVHFIDLSKEEKTPGQPVILSKEMRNRIQSTLDDKGQVILFQNRRGFAPILECQRCNWTPECQNCDVSLTYHKQIHTLKCHYCGFSRQFPTKCESCGHDDLRTKSFGTERIEEELRIRFPSARIGRMDWDTTRRKHAYQEIIDQFARGEMDILVGTQMLTKGLDFDGVRMVGILAADTMMQYPDFRAFERAFQLMVQVSGRAGRKEQRGKVYIQSYKPDHPLLLDVQKSDYERRADLEIKKRKEFHYPPFYRLIRLNIRHRDRDRVSRAAEALARPLRKQFPQEVLGPEFPAIPRVRNQYHKNIMLKLGAADSLNRAKEMIRQYIEQLKDHSDFKGVRVVIDIDPQ